MRQPEVYEDGCLYYRNQYERQGQALFHKGYYHEYSQDGHCVDHLKIVISGLYHVLHARRLADQHAAFIVLFQDAVEAVDLGVHSVTGSVVFRVYQEQLPFVVFKCFGKLLRQELFRDVRSHHALKA